MYEPCMVESARPAAGTSVSFVCLWLAKVTTCGTLYSCTDVISADGWLCQPA
jgi:hypothetical protein